MCITWAEIEVEQTNPRSNNIIQEVASLDKILVTSDKETPQELKRLYFVI